MLTIYSVLYTIHDVATVSHSSADRNRKEFVDLSWLRLAYISLCSGGRLVGYSVTRDEYKNYYKDEDSLPYLNRVICETIVCFVCHMILLKANSATSLSLFTRTEKHFAYML